MGYYGRRQLTSILNWPRHLTLPSRHTAIPSFPRPLPSFPRKRESRGSCHRCRPFAGKVLDSRFRGNDGGCGDGGAGGMTARRVWRDAGNDGGGGYGAMPGMTAAAGMMAMLGMNVTAGMTATGGMTSATIPDGHHSRRPPFPTAAIPDGRHSRPATIPDGHHSRPATIPDGHHRPPLAPPSFPRKRESRGSC